MAMTSWKRIKSAAKSEFILNKKLFFITLLFSLAGGAYNVFDLGKVNYYNDADGSMTELDVISIDSGFGFILFGVAVLCGICSTISVFKDMYSKQHADVQLSLPLSAKERFFSKLLTICFINIIPVMGSLLLSSAGSAIRFGFAPDVLALLGEILLLILSFVLFTDAVTTFCVCCCGTFAESVYISVIMLGCLSAAPAVFFNKIIKSFAGLEISEKPEFLNFWTYSPFVSFRTMEVIPELIIGLVVSCLISIGLMLMTYFVYRKRDAVSAGRTIVYKYFFETFMFIGTFTVLTLASFTEVSFMGIIVCILITIVIRVVVSRAKVKAINFVVWAVKFIACFAVFMAISAIGYVTDGFGYMNYKPDLSSFDDCYANIMIDVDSTTTDAFSSESITNEQVNEILDFVKSHSDVKDHSLRTFLSYMMGNNGGDLFEGSFYSDAYINGMSVYIYNEENDKSYSIDIHIDDTKRDEIIEETKKLDFLKYKRNIYDNSY